LKIKQVRLKNFGSFYGEHTIDYTSKNGNNGFAFFGPEGRGKTTLVSSIIWCLYGSVEASNVFEGKYKTMKRPVIDADLMSSPSRSWYPPLLNDKAWGDGDYSMQVRINFEHKGKLYSLLRDAKKDKNNPKKDEHMSTKLHLSIDGVAVSTALVQHEIEEVIPHDVSKFFFFEGDKVDKYASLLFGEESNIMVKEEVERVLGLPALDRSQEDFTKMAEQSAKAISRQKRKNTIFEKYKDEWEIADSNVTAALEDLKITEENLRGTEEKREEIELKLSAEKSAEDLVRRKKEVVAKIKSIEESQEDAYEERRKILSGNIWMALIQPAIDRVSEDLQDLREKKKAKEKEAYKIEGKIEYNKSLLERESVECEVCGNETGAIESGQRESIKQELLDLESKFKSAMEDAEKMGDPDKSLDSLSKFRNSIDLDSLNSLEAGLGSKEVDRVTANFRLKEIEKEMQGHDVDIVKKLANQRKYCIETAAVQKQHIRNLKGELNYWDGEKSRIESMLPDEKDKPQVQQEMKTKQTYEWLAKCFSSAMEEFRQEARVSVEEYSSKAFLSIIEEPNKYSGISINDNWDIVVIDSKGDPQITINPGHKQVIAISILDGLRKTSKLQFPTFFDNPGANISNKTLDRMVKHFWEDQTNQVVMLSHGGGLKRGETIRNYGRELAKAWSLSYDESGTQSKIEEIDFRDEVET